MKTVYKGITLDSKKAFDQAERLQRQGWKIGQIGFCTVVLFKRVKETSDQNK